MIFQLNLRDKVKTLITRILSPDETYFDEQFMYGHREILLFAARQLDPLIPKDSFLLAGLQHGWTPEAGIWRVRQRNLRRAVRLVWNSKWEIIPRAKFRNIAIGAPWLYLLSLVGISQELAQNRFKSINSSSQRVLIFPGHSGLGQSKDLITQSDFFKSVLGNRKGTVCLFWLDFCNPKIRNAYTALDMDVTCLGFGSGRGVDAVKSEGGRPAFLIELLDLFLSFDYLIVDSVSSGVFYALTTGMNVEFYPNPITERFEECVVKDRAEFDGFNTNPKSWIEQNCPEVYKNGRFSFKDIELAFKELGIENLDTSQPLRHLPWNRGSKGNEESFALFAKSLHDFKEAHLLDEFKTENIS